MDIKGKIHEISEVMEVTASFRKRELVIEYAENPSYPEFIKFEAIQDRVSLMDKCKVGDMVEVSFNLKGRAWNNPKTGKTDYFNTLQIWRVNILTGAAAGAPVDEMPSFVPPDLSSDAGEADDLPF
ncbi:DUF3127 domain-containing protein [Solitalea lacus]|uniref:DUF3127 domain-containing protein n=1 Tax=Solitalea lacus TaxID=2911172 RepID=UPI001EDC12E9|nr:DUF3127 domain-containing protein [Solitalea lacus]UKJ08020.1 DUF3127 domain-containing protein [Solitalea lacus]